MSSTHDAAASSTNTERRSVGSMRASPIGSAIALHRASRGPSASARLGPIVASAALACPSVVPARSRATTLMKCCGVVR